MSYGIDELPQKCELNKSAIDLTNQKFYNLTFLYPCRVNNRLKWVCKCDCGNYIVAFSSNVKKGNTKSCGCIKKEQPSARKDLTGQKFGKLLVIGEPKNGQNGRGTLWLCQCDCGNKIYKYSTDLVNNKTRSCGCLKAELHSTMNDLTNQQFGDLIALYTDKVNEDGQRIWHCKCSCGKEIDVLAGNLRKGNTTSCGCKKSKNNELIEKILKNKKYIYQREYFFEDLKDKGYLRFDFALFDSDKKLIGLIEYQGIQHFQKVEYFGGEEEFKKQQIRDNLKLDYCKHLNIPLYYITYKDNTEKRLEEILNELYGK